MGIGQDTTPAPIGGWNARDQISDMKENEAITLENYFPSTSSVKLRGGHESYATGLGSNVESLMEYESGTASFESDGTGDYVSGPTTGAGLTDFAFGTSDFTIEFWVYFNSVPSTNIGLVSWGGQGLVSADYDGWLVAMLTQTFRASWMIYGLPTAPGATRRISQSLQKRSLIHRKKYVCTN